MFVNSCGGYLQIPGPMHLWHPYLVSGYQKKSSTGFHISDILHLAAPSTNNKIHQGDNHHDNGIHIVPSFASVPKDNFRFRTNGKGSTAQSGVVTGRSDDKISNVVNNADDNILNRRHENSDKCMLNSALGPLQALCKSGYPVHIQSRGQKPSHHSKPSISSSSKLKFGIHRILSEDFGKQTTEKGSSNDEESDDNPSYQRSCVCTSAACSTYHVTFPTHALTAVHALQPPQYPVPSGADTLPGPYSVLNTEVNVGGHQKRKRSWSRAVFSNLQRKGLEKRFEVQKYVTKPDRRQLAAMLGLTDAQVKVWFQNRRMKWRHAQQQKQKDDSDQNEAPHSPGSDVLPENLDIDNDEEHMQEDSDELPEENEIGELPGNTDTGAEQTSEVKSNDFV